MRNKQNSTALNPAWSVASALWGLMLFACGLLAQAGPPVIDYFSPTGGPTGTRVTIGGSNFASTDSTSLQVTLNGAAAPLLNVAPNEIILSSPGGTENAAFVVSSSGGMTSTTQAFIVSPLSVQVTPERISIFPGQSRAIAAQPIGAGPNVTWAVNGIEGGNADVGIVTQTNPTQYTAPANPPSSGWIFVTAALSSNPAVKATIPVHVNDPSGGVPDLYPPWADPADFSLHAEIGLQVSRTRVLVLLPDGGTLAPLVPVLSQANAQVIGGAPQFNTMLVAIPDAGDHTQVDQLVAQLAALPQVEAAEHDTALGDLSLPPYIDSSDKISILQGAGGNQYYTYWNQQTNIQWDLSNPPLGNAWGMSYANFPPAWSLFHYVDKLNTFEMAAGKRGRFVNVGVVDGGILSTQEDLVGIAHRMAGANPGNNAHGTHVSGTIGANWGDGKGIQGASPFVTIYNQGYAPDPNHPDWSDSLGDSIMLQVRYLVQNTAGLPGGLRAVNFSQGYNWFDNQLGAVTTTTQVGSTWKWGHDINGNFGVVDLPAPPYYQERQRRLVEAHGKIARKMADWIANSASGNQAIFVAAAGNDGNDVRQLLIDNNWADLTLNSPDASTRMDLWLRPSAEYGSPFTWASYNGASNVVVIEALIQSADRDHPMRTDFSQVARPNDQHPNWDNGFSAPGDSILSCSLSNGTFANQPPGLDKNKIYEIMSGTSMAAPHVTGLIAYLCAVDPDLTIPDILTILRRTSRPNQFPNGNLRGASSIDAFAAVREIDAINKDKGIKPKWVKKALLNIDDGTVDGVDREVSDDAHGSGILPDDMKINLADFRRYRDAIISLTPGLGTLNGPASSLKFDVNQDGQINTDLHETYFPRADFNGDAEVTIADLAEMADTELWDDPDFSDAGLTDAQLLTKLKELMFSGDYKIDADDLLREADIDRIKVQAFVDTSNGTKEYTLEIGEGDIKTSTQDLRKILTVPCDESVRLSAIAYLGNQEKYFLLSPDNANGRDSIQAGEDKTITLEKTGVEITPASFNVSVNETAAVEVAIKLEGGTLVENNPALYTLNLAPQAGVGVVTPTATGFTVRASSAVGTYKIEANLVTKDGTQLSPESKPTPSTLVTIRTAVVKNPAGMALDGANNLYVTDSERNRIIMVPPNQAGFTLKDNLDTPGPLEVDAKGRSIIFGEAEGKVTRLFFGLSGTVVNTSGSLVVGAKVYLDTPAGTLPGAASTENRILTNSDGKFTVFGLLAPEMGADPVKVSVTVEYKGKPQSFPVMLKPVGQTFVEFKLKDEEE